MILKFLLVITLIGQSNYNVNTSQDYIVCPIDMCFGLECDNDR